MGVKNHKTCSSHFHEVTFVLQEEEEVLGFGLGVHSLADIEEVRALFPDKA